MSFRPRHPLWLSLSLLTGIIVHGPAEAEPAKRPELTREGFRRNCLMCHSRAVPEGISDEVLDGLRRQPGLTPFGAMPNLTCWRNCVTCYQPDKPHPKTSGKM